MRNVKNTKKSKNLIYNAPKLTRYGKVTELTAAATGPGSENGMSPRRP